MTSKGKRGSGVPAVSADTPDTRYGCSGQIPYTHIT